MLVPMFIFILFVLLVIRFFFLYIPPRLTVFFYKLVLCRFRLPFSCILLSFAFWLFCFPFSSVSVFVCFSFLQSLVFLFLVNYINLFLLHVFFLYYTILFPFHLFRCRSVFNAIYVFISVYPSRFHNYI